MHLRRGNLSQMVEEYLQRERDSFPAEGHLEWQIEPGLIARFEADSLETVLRNLFENALLYSDGPIVVRVELYSDGETAHLVFSDQGCGIPPQYRKKVFRMFYRIKQAGKSIRGSGLGLFIVRNVIRHHGGKVWIENPKDGKGSAFHLAIPLLAKEQCR